MTTRKIRIYPGWSYEREEEWLSEMAKNGKALCNIRFPFYTFEKTKPSEYQVRLTLLDKWPNEPESMQYIRFVEETGAEYIGSVMRWAYFRKKSSEGEFSLLSDYPSKIRQLRIILIQIGLVLALCLYNMFSAFSDYGSGGTALNLGIAVTMLIFSLLLAWGFLKIFRKKIQLEKENELFE